MTKRVVVVGAGWAGLVAAKTYLQIDPTIDLTIIDAEKSIGGVWCAERVYPGFYADSPVGLFDFSDLPMRNVIGIKDWADLPGSEVHLYLKAYAEKFGLLQRLRLRAKVSRVTRNEDSQRWDVSLENGKEIVTCDKLILATGLTSEPKWPDIPYKEFSGLVIHSKDVGIHHQALTSSRVERITVYGGNKSAIDTINLCILAGKKVDWIMRETGNGPGMMIETRKHGIHGAALVGRWKNIFTPSIFSTEGFWYRFLHSGKSSFGTWIFKRFWHKASTVPLSMEPYKTRSESIEQLYPETRDALFFTASISALHGNEEFVKQLHSGELITVHRATITSVHDSNVSLSTGIDLYSDAVVFATGWDHACKVLDPSTAIELGISAPLEAQDVQTANYWADLHTKADADVLGALPILGHPPAYNKKPVTQTPTRLYRHILPTALAAKDDHSLIFLGQVTSIMTSIYAEVAALWGVAWMEGLLGKTHPLPSKGDMDYEIARVNAWCARRYLVRGDTRSIASAEIQHVVDLLMKDLGLGTHRKGWLMDAIVPYRAQDYKGIVEDVLRGS